jgi:RHS repeat-associated protein
LSRGLVLPGLAGGNSTNRYKFNGKEAIAELGPGMYDFGTRLQDAAIGRMHTVDAAAELFAHVSGYSFGLNNPVYNIDPTGDTTVPAAQVDWHNFNTEVNDIGLSEVSVKATANDVATNTGAYVGQQIMDERAGFWDNLDQFWNGDRNYMGHQVDRNGVLTPYLTPITGTPPDVGVGRVGSAYKIGSFLAARQLASKSLKMILPAWKKVSVDIGHIASGHMEGGSRVSSLKTLFPSSMTQKQVERAVRSAYRNVSDRIQTQGDRILLQGTSDQGLKVEMWLNKATNMIETAYPIH